MPTVAQLKAFHALGKEGQFIAAAERLHITQPAVSIQIRKLEEESSRTLIRRGGQRIALTEDGRKLLALIERRIRLDDEITSFLAKFDAQQRQVIVLGADGPHVALDLIAVCQRANPNLEFDVKMANWRRTWENLLDLKIDAAIMADPPQDPRVHAEIICTQSLQAWIPSGNPLAGRSEVTLKQICGYPLIFREQGSGTQHLVNSALNKHRLSPRIAMRIGSREGMREAVARGVGIGFGFNRETERSPNYACVPITGYECTNTDMLLCLQPQRSSAIFRLLSQVIGEDMAAGFRTSF